MHSKVHGRYRKAHTDDPQYLDISATNVIYSSPREREEFHFVAINPYLFLCRHRWTVGDRTIFAYDEHTDRIYEANGGICEWTKE